MWISCRQLAKKLKTIFIHKLIYTLRWKLFLSYLLITIIPLLFFFNSTVASIQNSFREDREKQLLFSANIIARNISKANYLFDDTKGPLFDVEIDTKSKEGSFRVLVFDLKGVIVNDSNKTDIGKTLVMPEVLHVLQNENDVSLHTEERAIYATASIEDDKMQKIGGVLVVASAEDIFVSVSKIEQRVLLYSVITVIVLGIFVFFLSQILLKPLRNILTVIQKMTEGHLNQRVMVTGGHDEFAELGTAFNTMTQKLEEVEKTREEFVSNVSHELKTPLSCIKVLSESILLQEDVPVEMYAEFFHDINSEVDRMTDIINDLLALVRLEQREIPLNIKPVDLGKLVAEIADRLMPLATHKNLTMEFKEERKVTISGDEMKLTLALSNLVENAIKYTHEGGVTITVDCDHQNAFVTVQDTGVGISPDDQSKIFNRFYRVDKTRDRETGGTGLGLSITQKTILMHNGSIKITSREQEGTVFVVRLPIHHS